MKTDFSSTLQKNLIQRAIRIISIALILSSFSGCSLFIDSATRNFGEQMRHTLLNHDDPETVSAALPTYLLSLETLLTDNHDAGLWLTTAKLYNAYIGLLPDEDAERKALLSRKALDFATRGICFKTQTLCRVQHITPGELQGIIATSEADELDGLYTLATTWAGWIQNHKNDWNAIAQLTQVKAIMQRIIAIDAHYQQGNPYLYLGVLESLVPASLGGQPDIAKQHFEHAMQQAPNNLMAPLLYAKHYARMQFDRELHDQLLNSVLAADPIADELTLINHMAQKQARALLKNANQYF